MSNLTRWLIVVLVLLLLVLSLTVTSGYLIAPTDPSVDRENADYIL